jgi:hypothetical protein
MSKHISYAKLVYGIVLNEHELEMIEKNFSKLPIEFYEYAAAAKSVEGFFVVIPKKRTAQIPNFGCNLASVSVWQRKKNIKNAPSIDSFLKHYERCFVFPYDRETMERVETFLVYV